MNVSRSARLCNSETTVVLLDIQAQKADVEAQKSVSIPESVDETRESTFVPSQPTSISVPHPHRQSPSSRDQLYYMYIPPLPPSTISTTEFWAAYLFQYLVICCESALSSLLYICRHLFPMVFYNLLSLLGPTPPINQFNVGLSSLRSARSLASSYAPTAGSYSVGSRGSGGGQDSYLLPREDSLPFEPVPADSRQRRSSSNSLSSSLLRTVCISFSLLSINSETRLLYQHGTFAGLKWRSKPFSNHMDGSGHDCLDWESDRWLRWFKVWCVSVRICSDNLFTKFLSIVTAERWWRQWRVMAAYL